MFLSVITVVYNDINGIECTLNSCFDQDRFDLVEYIVIDGDSNDGTKEIINDCRSNIDIFISEKDEGIYDAMNKGIALASGDFVIFLNSGDVFCNNNIVSQLYSVICQNSYYDIFYSGVKTDYGNRIISFSSKNLKSIPSKLPFNHQCSIVRLSLMKIQIFNTQFRFAADYDFFFRMYNEGRRFKKLDFFLCKVEGSGVSVRSSEKTSREIFQIFLRYSTLKMTIQYLPIHIFRLLKERLKSYFPKSIVNRLIVLKRRF